MGSCPELSTFTNLRTTNSLLVDGSDSNAEYTNGNGEYTYDQLAVLERRFVDGIVDDSENNPLVGAVNQYGSENFYIGLNELNNLLGTGTGTGSTGTGTGSTTPVSNALNNNSDEYSVIYRRVQEGTRITPFEFAQFINDYNYTPTTVVNSNSVDILTNLNSFYNGPWSASVMGGFCGQFSNIFAAVALFNQLDQFTGNALDALNKIKGFDPEEIIQAAADKITNIANIKDLKANIEKIIDSKVKEIVNAVKNFDIANVIGQVETFINNNIIKKVSKIKENILSFFQGDFIQKIKDKVNGLVDYATNLFQNPSLETIQFMIARFCGMASFIEQMLDDTKKPLDQFARKYAGIYDTMKRSSNLATARALENGAIRFSDQRRRELINRINERNYQPPRTTGGSSNSGQEVDEIPDLTGRLERPVTDRERMALPTWEDLIGGDPRIWHAETGETYTYYTTIDKSGAGPSQIWEEMDEDTRCLIMRVQKRWGKRLRLRSGFRGNGANEWLRTFKSGVAKNSKHKQGIAADLSWDGMTLTEKRQFKRIAIEEGFYGVGIYSNFVHIDTRKTPYYWYG